jgi:P27 family predicted phage terminase small subunit
MPRGGNHSSKPATVKALEGNRSKVSRAKLEALVEREPKGRGKPKPPPHLSAEEQEEFRHVLDTAPAAILTGADQTLLENYCVAVCVAREAHGELQATGKLVQGNRGQVVNPFWRLWRQSVELSRMMGSELGLSPASRARIQVEPEKSDDPMALLLGPDGDPNGAWLTLKTRQ